MDLVEIGAAQFDVEFEIAYATANNLTGEPIYRRAACYLHADAAELLDRAIALAAELGLRLKIFDAFRPVEAQWVLWNHTPDPEFLADPRKGSPHSRGVAIDLTLIDGTGAPLEMGTEFDAFTPDAHHGVTGVSVKAQGNRYLLLG
ncbi:MAG: D-alanyl-D-alanine dipeptidase, partial [Proteobacteria bacterium]|nr:D-alanyl-D-alanine dipeptidase [Pseudomonadota bacterium]